MSRGWCQWVVMIMAAGLRLGHWEKKRNHEEREGRLEEEKRDRMGKSEGIYGFNPSPSSRGLSF